VTPRIPLTHLVVLALAGATAACHSTPQRAAPPVPVTVAAVKQEDVPTVVTVNGAVEPMQTAAVESQVNGILTRVAFTEGQDVRAGQVLFQIDPAPYAAVVAQAEGAVARDQAQAAAAQRDAERYRTLVQKEYVTQSQADQAAATAAAQAATVAADRGALQRARIDLTNTTIRAPISGRTGSLLVRKGNLVKANSAPPLVVINQIRPILVRFSLPQERLPELQRYGAGRALPVSATPSEASGVTSYGTLSFIDNAVDSATGTVLLKGRFDNREGALWPGQFVTVTLQLFVQHGALVVPARAVLTGQQGTYVFIVDGTGHARQQPVTVSQTNDSIAVVSRGLTVGQRLVVDGQSRLTPGARVVVKPAAPPPAPAAPPGGSTGAGSGGPGAQ